jgi:hypothetical protein
VRWAEFGEQEVQLATLGRKMLGEPGVVLVATIRNDGTPRVSPVEPLFWADELWLSMGLGTRKAADLARDPRILVHSIVASRDGTNGEYKVRGQAIADNGADLQEAYADVVASTLGWHPEPGRFHLFRVDVEDVTYIRWDDATNDQYVTRWPHGGEFYDEEPLPRASGTQGHFTSYWHSPRTVPNFTDRPVTSSLPRPRWVASRPLLTRLQFPPTSGSIVGGDLLEHGRQRSDLDAISLAIRDGARGLVVVARCDETFRIRHDPPVVQEQIHVVLRG